MTFGVIFIYYFSLRTLPLELARSAAFIGLIFFSVLNVLNARSLEESLFRLPPFSNLFVWVSVFVSLILSLLTLYFPIFQKAFGLASLPGIYLLEILFMSFAIIGVMELNKFFLKKQQ